MVLVLRFLGRRPPVLGLVALILVPTGKLIAFTHGIDDLKMKPTLCRPEGLCVPPKAARREGDNDEPILVRKHHADVHLLRAIGLDDGREVKSWSRDDGSTGVICAWGKVACRRIRHLACRLPV